MDSAGSVPRSEDPPSPLPPGLVGNFMVNCVGTLIAVVTLGLPATVVTHYSQQGAAVPSPVPVTVVGRSPKSR